jgi:ferrous iron transport protein B
MATRVIDNRRDRLTTILIAPLMTCSARIPVYTLIISAFIPPRLIWGWINLQGLVMFGLYSAGIASALGMSFLIKFFMWRDYQPAPFMLELPDYKMPRLRSVAIGVYTRARMFLQRAGTTIFAMMVVIWFLASFPQPPVGATDPPIDYSLAAMIGKAIEPLLLPVGFNWQIAVALIPGMAAREVAVAALGTVYAIEGGKEAAAQIGEALASKWTLATALSLLAWYVFAPQCASTLAVIRRETGSWKWMAVSFIYMLTLAYLASLATYNVAVGGRPRLSAGAAQPKPLSEIVLHDMQVGRSHHAAVEARIDDPSAGLYGRIVAEVVGRFEHEPGHIDRRSIHRFASVVAQQGRVHDHISRTVADRQGQLTAHWASRPTPESPFLRER